MGVAAYNRGNRVISQQIAADIAAVQNTLDAKAQLWCSLLKRGHILHFRAPDGEPIVAGPLHRADGSISYGARRYGRSRWAWPRSPAGDHEGSAWGAALWIIDHVGRVRPYRVARDD